MKIGILTQPLLTNYGGLLQAYALQTVLKEKGHEAWVINRKYSKPTLILNIKSKVKRLLAKNVLRNSNLTINPNLNEEEIIAKHTNYFKNKYIHLITDEVFSDYEMNNMNALNFDAFIVGSDQVWRPRYSPNIYNYFLDFTNNTPNVLRISYAASFGVDNWEFTEEQTEYCSKLSQKFNAISVRENSGITLCEKHLNAPATHVLDPTMLLGVEKYKELIRNENEPQSQGTLMTYVLDNSEDKVKFIQDAAGNLNLKSFTVMQNAKLSGKSTIEDAVFPPVTKWLRGFMDAEFVITDSFHGCAFAIIFNKPFLALGNRAREIARFTSLLKLFNLEDRLILDDFSFNNKMIEKDINWNEVNKSLRKHQEISNLFLDKALIRL